MTRTIRLDRKLVAAGTAFLLLALSAPVPAPAHHSTANFDMTKTNTITGTVTYFSYTNPHSFCIVAGNDHQPSRNSDRSAAEPAIPERAATRIAT